MNFLFDNPLANMQGSTFLVLYAVAIATAIFVFWLIKNTLDWTAKSPLPPIPHNPDVYEIAYLRGGENEVARAVIFSLMQKGLVEMTKVGKEDSFRRIANRETGNLSPLESAALNWFRSGHIAKEIFAAGGLSSILQTYCGQYEANLTRLNFFTDSVTTAKIWQTAAVFAIPIIGLGGYKLAAAIAHGHSNVLFLIIFTIIGIFAIAAVARVPRISKLGKNYMARLQTVFGSVKSSAFRRTSAANPVFNSVDPLLLTVGVFGVGSLAGTAYGDYEKAFHRASSSSSCGSGCGSSSCSSGGGDGGGGCGGGCGGCS